MLVTHGIFSGTKKKYRFPRSHEQKILMDNWPQVDSIKTETLIAVNYLQIFTDCTAMSTIETLQKQKKTT
jgi:hypothetical protein